MTKDTPGRRERTTRCSLPPRKRALRRPRSGTPTACGTLGRACRPRLHSRSGSWPMPAAPRSRSNRRCPAGNRTPCRIRVGYRHTPYPWSGSSPPRRFERSRTESPRHKCFRRRPSVPAVRAQLPWRRCPWRRRLRLRPLRGVHPRRLRPGRWARRPAERSPCLPRATRRMSSEHRGRPDRHSLGAVGRHRLRCRRRERRDRRRSWRPECLLRTRLRGPHRRRPRRAARSTERQASHA